MKKIITIIAGIIVLSTMNIKAQITLEHVFDSTNINPVYCTDIGNYDYKYVVLDLITNKFSLYNMDMSPYMTNITIPATADSIKNGFTVIYVTKALFDCDSTNIEYVYETQFDVKHKFRVFRTDGTLLLDVDSTNGPYCFGCYGGSIDERPIINTSSGAKLFLQKYDNNNVPQIWVYSLCGTLPMDVYDFTERKNYVKIFPNPTALELTFDVIFPSNKDDFQITLYNIEAREARKTFPLSQGRNAVDVSGFSSGVYIYSLTSKGKVYQTGKFVLSK